MYFLILSSCIACDIASTSYRWGEAGAEGLTLPRSYGFDVSEVMQTWVYLIITQVHHHCYLWVIELHTWWVWIEEGDLWGSPRSGQSYGWRVLQACISQDRLWYSLVTKSQQLRFIFGSCKVRCKPGDSPGYPSVVIYLVAVPSACSLLRHWDGKEKGHRKLTPTLNCRQLEVTRFTSQSPRAWLITWAQRSLPMCPGRRGEQGRASTSEPASFLLSPEWPAGWETLGLLPFFPFLGHGYTQLLLPESTLALCVWWIPAKWNWELT